MRRKMFFMGVFISFSLPLLAVENTITIGKVMYQNQTFSSKDKQIFDADQEGSRVWSLGKAVKYCEKLKLDGYDDWRVASKKEFQAIMAKKVSKRGLYVKSAFASKMPALGGKYDDVWMWTRFSKTPNLGEYVNFKKANSGWADKKYKGYVICSRKATALSVKQKSTACKGNARQELSHSTDWVKAWNTCSGYAALKKDGSLWQFGEVGGCNRMLAIMNPIDPQTGEPIYKTRYVYHLKAKKIGSGFRRAKIINGGYRIYAIKRDGTLWGWGKGLGVKPKKLISSKNWSDFGIKYEGNGCCGYDIGLKKDGSLWRIPETAFSLGKYKTAFKLQKISRFSDWKKIAIGCCTIYGLREDGTLWKTSFDEELKRGKVVFKRFKPKKRLFLNGDMELYPLLKSKMAKIPSGRIYSPDFIKSVKVNRNGTLFLLPERVW